MLKKINIAIFASGAGSNAEVIIKNSIENEVNYNVQLIVTNKPNAGVIAVANNYKIKVLIIEKKLFHNTNTYISLLKNNNIEYIILAGFLWKMPINFIEAFENKIINIHPALLPKYGGKGMYGNNVHQAVIDNKEIESGITIHFVNENYDEGAIVFQEKCNLANNEKVETLAAKIHYLEHLYYWEVINKLCINELNKY